MRIFQGSFSEGPVQHFVTHPANEAMLDRSFLFSYSLTHWLF
jgi:hypothetical protein